MSEKKIKEERKTIKEEMSEKKITIYLRPDGSVKYEWSSGLDPSDAVFAMRTIIDNILVNTAVSKTLNTMAQQQQMKKMGIIKQ